MKRHTSCRISAYAPMGIGGAKLKQNWGPEMPPSDSFAYQTHLQPYERPRCLWGSKPANQSVRFTAEAMAARGGRARGGPSVLLRATRPTPPSLSILFSATLMVIEVTATSAI
jgi:hypothetical protein